jgi:membrane-associated protease RseP (regulator of RpoE activity)
METMTPDILNFASMSLGQSPLIRLWDSIWPYMVMLLGFSFIVFVHELGHFLVAKWAGVRVERFAIGFGRELFGFTSGETRYSFNILPLGGYVKMLGQEDFDDKSEELKFKDDPRSFINKPVGHRMAIVSAGVVMNIILACILFMIVFLVGKTDPAPRIAIVEPDSPAEEAGIMPGDLVTAMNGHRVLTFKDVLMNVFLAPPHEPIQFEIERNGEAIPPIYVLPEKRRPEGTRGGSRLMVGIGPGNTSEIVWLPPGLDQTKEDLPHVGDRIVEVDGIAVDDNNVNSLLSLLGHGEGQVVVERPESKKPGAPRRRVSVNMPTLFSLYPADPMDKSTASVLGLRPLMRFAVIQPQGRAAMAGIEIGDTILAWDDQPYPDVAFIAASVRDQAEHDIAFTVQSRDGSLRTGFVRPKRENKGRGTIAAIVKPMDPDIVTPDGPRAIVYEVREGGVAAEAGLRQGDRILECNGVERPISSAVNRLARSLDRKPFTLKVESADGTRRTVFLKPAAPGVIAAAYSMIAEDVLIVGESVANVSGKSTPASEANIPRGAEILSVDDQEVRTWTELISAFRKHSGTVVPLKFQSSRMGVETVDFRIPASLRTLLNLGPEARIVSIDGKKSVEVETQRGKKSVAAYYHFGTKALLKGLVGQQRVPIQFRANPLAKASTAYLDITEDMVDPWVARIAFTPNVGFAEETTLVKGQSAWDAVGIGFHQTYYVVIQVYQTIKRMVYSRSVGVENISGPLGIVSIGGQIARMGWVDTFFFMAMISANLAVINFLPLPIVDGGLMVFLIIEKIKGSPVSLRVQVATQMIGLALIISCFLFVTYNDAIRLWGS